MATNKEDLRLRQSIADRHTSLANQQLGRQRFNTLASL
jgi:hypothetical protein